MADGTYRVTSDEDGGRTLYLFPPNGGHYRMIHLDTDEPEEESDDSGPVRAVCVALHADPKTTVLPWSPSVFETLLDELSAAQRQSPAIGQRIEKERP